MKPHWSEIYRSPADADTAGADAVGDASSQAGLQDRTQSWSDNGKEGSLYDEAATVAPDAAPSDADRSAPDKAGDGQWPDDWRAQMANGDAKAARLLERYTSPDAVGKALMSAQHRIRSGEVKLRPGPEATEEQRAEWRLEHGIPETAKGYDVPILLDGKYEDLDEFGKASIDAFRGTFHELDMPPEHAEKIMSVANDVAVQQMERQAETDAMRQEDTEDSLRMDWGADYKKNIALNAQFMQDKLGDSWQSFVTARTPEGLRLADDPKFNKFINQMARAEGGTVLQTGETAAGHNVQARIEEIRKIMSTDYSKYKREGLDVEYSKLLDRKQ
ncbi:MAG: hypothetical protein AAFW74_14040 [Pseudomonadota bacterium]